jgi:hypothetical protein
VLVAPEVAGGVAGASPAEGYTNGFIPQMLIPMASHLPAAETVKSTAALSPDRIDGEPKWNNEEWSGAGVRVTLLTVTATPMRFVIRPLVAATVMSARPGSRWWMLSGSSGTTRAASAAPNDCAIVRASR